MHDIRLLIRQEEGGEVSTYLHRLPEQSTIELRGPKVEWQLPDDIREVIFLAGGTGIAPAMQVAQVIGAKPRSRMHILWANRRREECLGGVSDENDASEPGQGRPSWWKRLLGYSLPASQEKVLDAVLPPAPGVIVQELEALKKRNAAHSSGLYVQYYVDEENKMIKKQDIVKRLGAGAPETGSGVILISGPDGFIEYWAGKKLWVGGREVQGPLGGVLGNMDLKGWSVVKL
jgi:ferredoxin-NADP reductase